MRIMAAALAALALFGAGAAQAEVIDQSPAGFTVRHTVSVAASAAEGFDAFIALPSWWDPAHTYTGNTAYLDFTPVVGGCWCERFPDGGGVEHMRVIYLVPGGGPIRLRGGLGPLQSLGAEGVMTVDFEDAADGSGSSATLTYIVTGPIGTGDLGGPVDFVLGQAVARFAAYAGELGAQP